MKSFSNYLTEAADSNVNLHLTHVDEDLFERGNDGAKAAIVAVRDVLETLGQGNIKLTVKWDGAPAIFCGKDPEDGKFFVGTKSVFAKNAKLVKSKADIKAHGYPAGLADKLQYALDEFPKIGIPDGIVLQGDLMFTKGDQNYETIDGKRYIVAHPNTIAYAWEAESDVGKDIRNANIGVVWHTTYSGKGTLSTYRAKFGVNVKKLKKTRTVWQDDAYFKAGTIAFNQKEYQKIKALADQAESLIGDFDSVARIMDTLPSGAVGAGIKTFINSKIRNGQLPNPANAVNEYYVHVKEKFEKQVIAKVKTEASKESKRAIMKQFLEDCQRNHKSIVQAFEFVDVIVKAKVAIIAKLESINTQKSFVKTKDGFKVTGAEGYVAINPSKGEAVKFVDRIAFSHFNFNPEYIKGWMK